VERAAKSAAVLPREAKKYVGRETTGPTPQSAAPRKERGDRHLPALTGFRFLLALWVIVHHLTGPPQPLGIQALRLPAPLYQLIHGGYLAVQTFFVLSGFVLARSYSAARWSGPKVRQYFLARFARVYPVYLLSLAVVAPFIMADRTPGKAWFLAAYGALVQGWLGGIPVNWNTPAWSLSCEIFFYTLFPLAVILIRKPRWRTVIALGATACVMTPFGCALGLPDGVKPLVHLSDFVMGIATAGAFGLLQARRGLRLTGAWLYLPALATAAALIAWPGLLPSAVGLNNVLRPLNAVLFIGLALGGGVVARALSSGLLVYLGKSSYAMYILHVPIMWWCLRRGGISPVLYVSLVIGVSALVYRVYEEPANRWLRGRIR